MNPQFFLLQVCLKTKITKNNTAKPSTSHMYLQIRIPLAVLVVNSVITKLH